MPLIRVAAISNSRSFLADVRRLFAGDRRFEFVGSRVREGIGWPDKGGMPDVLLVDGRIDRPLDLCSRVRREGGPSAVVIAQEAKDLAEFGDLWKMAALDAGARGVLARGSMARDLLDAVRAVYGGHIWGPRAVLAGALDSGLPSFQETEAGEAQGEGLVTHPTEEASARR